MAFQIAWASLYLQFSSFNFLMSGLTGDLLCLRFFLSCSYIWLLVNAVTGFPNLGELLRKPDEVFILHIDTLLWTIVTLYVHASKFTGIVLNERKVDVPQEGMPLWRMLYRNSGLSQLLFCQFIFPSKFQLVEFQKGTRIPTDDCLYIILDGVACTNITLQTSSPVKKNMKQETQQTLSLTSGEIINVKLLHLFSQGAECEAFASQTVNATCVTDVTVYRIHAKEICAMALQPQTKQAFQGLLIFALTNVAERALLDAHYKYKSFAYERRLGPDGRDPAFQPLEEWEEPQAIHSGSGKALTIPLQHFWYSLKKSFRPPWPILKWMPGLRHAALPAPHLLPGMSKHGGSRGNSKLDRGGYGSTMGTASTSSSSSSTTGAVEERENEGNSGNVDEELQSLF